MNLEIERLRELGRIRNRRYHAKHKDAIRARLLASWAANPEKKAAHDAKMRIAAAKQRAKNSEVMNARTREWFKKNPEYSKNWARNNPEKRRAIAARTRAKHPEKAKLDYQKKKAKDPFYFRKYAVSQRAYQQRNKSKRRAKQKEWVEKNRDKVRATARRYIKNHKALHAARGAKRRALKRQSTVNLSQITEWMESVHAKKFATCYWCQLSIASSLVHFDHIVPLSKGGPHTIENLCVSCEHCNLSKKDRDVRVWTKINQTFLEL
jgi:5-methylcytosine-specific restriction endonuclease McrA